MLLSTLAPGVDLVTVPEQQKALRSTAPDDRPFDSGRLPSRGDADPERSSSRIPSRATGRVSYARQQFLRITRVDRLATACCE